MPEPDRCAATLSSSDARALTCAHRQQTARATLISAIRNFALTAAIGIAALGKALISPAIAEMTVEAGGAPMYPSKGDDPEVDGLAPDKPSHAPTG